MRICPRSLEGSGLLCEFHFAPFLGKKSTFEASPASFSLHCRSEMGTKFFSDGDQKSLLYDTRVGFSDGGPTLYVVPGRAKPVLHGPNSTESNLYHNGETTYRVG